MHHLQIMESLGGDSLWLDRFMAQHGAIVYYWVLIGARLLTISLGHWHMPCGWQLQKTPQCCT